MSNENVELGKMNDSGAAIAQALLELAKAHYRIEHGSRSGVILSVTSISSKMLQELTENSIAFDRGVGVLVLDFDPQYDRYHAKLFQDVSAASAHSAQNTLFKQDTIELLSSLRRRVSQLEDQLKAANENADTWKGIAHDAQKEQEWDKLRAERRESELQIEKQKKANVQKMVG